MDGCKRGGDELVNFFKRTQIKNNKKKLCVWGVGGRGGRGGLELVNFFKRTQIKNNKKKLCVWGVGGRGGRGGLELVNFFTKNLNVKKKIDFFCCCSFLFLFLLE